MSDRRHFLGWDQPILPRAAAWLIDRYATDRALDLGRVVVVTPGGRAGRRLVEWLVDLAEQRKLDLTPPLTATPGTLGERLFTPSLTPADAMTQQLAWIDACRDADPALQQCLTPQPPARDDWSGWWALSGRLMRCHVELAAEALNFADLVERGQTLVDFPEAQRWSDLARLQQRYLQRLQDCGRVDPQQARIDALNAKECRSTGPIVLVGVAELPGVLVGMIEQAAAQQPVEVLVGAPRELADCFDAWGRLIAERWRDRPVELDDAVFSVVDGPADQATEVLHTLSEYAGRWSAEQITIGVPDGRLIAYLRQHLSLAGVAVRDAGGTPLPRTAVYRLLEAAADYLAERRYSDFAVLVRHPDVARRLVERSGEPITAESIDAWLDVMDRYYTEHLQGKLTGRWLGIPARIEPLRRVHEAVNGPELLEPLGESRPLSQWGQPILELLIGLYGEHVHDLTRPDDRLVHAACVQVREVLAEWRDLPESLDVQSSASQALRLLLQRLSEAAIPPRAEESAVELLGPLELALDDAPAMIVTTFNEDYLPTSLNADALLPNALRRAAGLIDNDRRYARDAYAMNVIARSRSQLKLIAARTDASGDPLRPSRLMFADDDAAIVRRVRLFYPSQPTPPRLIDPSHLGVGGVSAFDRDWPPPPPARPLDQPITRLNVTAFADYLACPYRFYLSHVLGLDSVNDGAVELSAAQFGTLAHQVLADFARDYRDDPRDARLIEAFCLAELDRQIERQYGPAPTPTLRIQREQLRLRLRDFAKWQADRAADGWRIAQAEWKIDPAPLIVDGQPVRVGGETFQLYGRIDRVDVHETEGTVCVLDYKTSNKPKKPKEKHQKGDEWVDLQLPLYRHLLSATALGRADEVGYVCLSREGCEMHCARWDEADYQAADAIAREVIEQINAGVFYPPADSPPAFDAFAALCGVDQLRDRDDDDDAGEDPS